MSETTVLLLGSDTCFLRMLTYELRRAGYAAVGAGELRAADCVVVDLDTVPVIPAVLPAVAYSRGGQRTAEGIRVLSRPFAIHDLLAALAALPLRDGQPAPPLRLSLDARARMVRYGPRSVTLTPGEFALLHCLAASPGKIVSRAELLALLPESNSNVLEATMYTLRRKLEGEFSLRPIRSVRGAGYRLLE